MGNENDLRSRGTASRESLTDLHLFSLEMRRWGRGDREWGNKESSDKILQIREKWEQIRK